MRIEFLGTAAAEAFPDPFCDCEYCEASRKSGGKSLRLRASVLINDELIIDLGPDLHVAAYRRGTSFAGVRYALQTHPHNDHAAPQTMYMRSDDCLPQGIAELTYALSPAAVDVWDQTMEDHRGSFRDADVQAKYHLRIVQIEPWQTFTLGPYEIQTVAASHATPALQPMLFAIRDTRDGGTVFYGTDTGRLPENTWSRLATLGWQLEVLILDHTRGFRTDLRVHLGQPGFLAEVEAARYAGAINDETHVIATHFAHHSHAVHEELVDQFAEHGYEPAWDGLVVETA